MRNRLTQILINVGCLIAVSVILSGCGEDDPVQPATRFAPTLEQLWPHEDGNNWLYDLDSGSCWEEEAFVFGLLHDIGKIVFEEFLNEPYAQAIETARLSHTPLHQAEQAVIGVDHAEFGARLAQKWGLAPILCEAIGGHHDLDRCPSPETRVMGARVAVADYMSTTAGCPSTAEAPVEPSEAIWTEANLTGDQIAAALVRFFASFGEAEELILLAA